VPALREAGAKDVLLDGLPKQVDRVYGALGGGLGPDTPEWRTAKGIRMILF
jgi:hypothetical protein